MSFGCVLCIAIVLLLKEHEHHMNSQQPFGHLVRFTVEVIMSAPIFSPFSIPPTHRQTNMFCVNIYHNRLAITEQPKQITDKVPLSS